MPTTLSVNLNKIALLRNSRGRDFPSLTDFGRLALTQGARGLTIHPRPDQRHARYDDIASLAALITEFPGS
jgi:pyridoxine 5-phosphate synthase